MKLEENDGVLGSPTASKKHPADFMGICSFQRKAEIKLQENHAAAEFLSGLLCQVPRLMESTLQIMESPFHSVVYCQPRETGKRSDSKIFKFYIAYYKRVTHHAKIPGTVQAY